MAEFKIQAETFLPTKFGDFNMIAFSESDQDERPHVAVLQVDADVNEVLDVRLHSECLTGDLLGSVRCECGEQLDYSLEYMSKHKGCVLYLRQEGRGIGILNKMKAYQLQDQGMDTVEANVHLGFEPDQRDFSVAVKMLELMGVKKIRLMTNNPMKIESFDGSGIEVVERIPIVIPSRKENKHYLEVKRDKMRHLFDSEIR